jgi:hypothetical protein
MDKHTRPYTCKNPICNGINFGDRAGLQRHEREKHEAVKYFCQISACPRHRKGFARKTHLELHVGARHKSGASKSEAIFNSVSNKKLEIMEEDLSETEKSGEMGRGIDGLKAKLKELETRKKLLAASQLKVEEDIGAVVRTLQLCGCEGS